MAMLAPLEPPSAAPPRFVPPPEADVVIDARPVERDQPAQLFASRMPGDPLSRALARSVQQRSEPAAALLHAPVLQRFKGNAKWAEVVAEFEEQYESLPDKLQVPDHLERRLGDLETFAAGKQIEDYSAMVVPKLGTVLGEVATELPGDAHASQRIAERVTDLLVASCLVVARGTSSRAEVISPQRLAKTLGDLAGELKAKTDFDETSLGRLGSSSSLPEDLLMLNLLNMSADAREELQETALFKALATSQILGDVMLASSGHEEQHFLSTCGIASVDQAVLSQVGSIAGLVFVGQKVMAAATGTLKANEQALRAKPAVLRHADQQQSLWEMAERAIAIATRELTDIEQRALQVIAGDGRTAAADLKALTLRWGRAMQAVIGVIHAPLRSAHARQSILTEKYIGNQWAASAVLAALWEGPGIFWRGEADARTTGPDTSGYRTMLGSLGLTIETANRTIRKSATEWRRQGVLEKLWEETAWRGGVPLSVPGHALYLKAVRRHGREWFLLGEPKGDEYEYLTPAELVGRVAGVEIDLPFDPFDGA